MPLISPLILVVDDESSVRRSLSVILKKLGKIHTAGSGEEALEFIENNPVDLILLDIRLPSMNGIEVLKKVKKHDPTIMVIMITAVKDTRTAVQAMMLDAYNYITKPFDFVELRLLAERALEKRSLITQNSYLRSEISKVSAGYDIIGESPVMKKIFRLIDKAAASNASVVIQGESGTGKELIARAIHIRGDRCARPFIVVNCAGIPDNLLESELFGHEAGSFTGAIERKHGKFEVAHGGSIFLDEIGSMPMALQAKILRVLQESKDGHKEIERVGSSKPISVDVRVISATNNDLMQAIKQGKFREDLFYRLNVIPIDVPPLRERKEDIPLLAGYYIDKYSRSMNKSISGIDDAVIDIFLSYSWPGNVREMKNIIERILTLKLEGDISIDDLPLEMTVPSSHTNDKKAIDPPFIAAKDQLERQFIMRALKKTGGNQIKAAKHLGMHRNSLRMKMKQFGIKRSISDISGGGGVELSNA